MDVFMMLLAALGCALLGWAVTYLVSESPTALNTGRRLFADSAFATGPERPGAQGKRRCTGRWITARRFSTAGRSRDLTEQ